MVEIAVATAIGGLMIVGSLNFFDSTKATKERMKEREKFHQQSFKHKFYGRVFSTILRKGGISVTYFKMPILLTQSNICGKVSGGCFMALDQTGKMLESGQDMPANKIFPQQLARKAGIKSNTGNYINLFKDEGGGWKNHVLTSSTKVNKLISMRYSEDVISSKNYRYFVGWTLRGKENEEPFYFMAQENNRSFEIDAYDASSQGALQSRLESLNMYSTATYNSFASSVFVRMKKTDNEVNLEQYKERFYLIMYPYKPEFYYVGYVSHIEECKSGSLSEICKNTFAALTMSGSSRNDGQQSYPISRNEIPQALENKINQNSDYRFFVLKMKHIDRQQWGPFRSSASELKKSQVYNWNSVSKASFFPYAKSHHNPYVPYIGSTIRMTTEFRDEDENILTREPRVLSPHFVTNVLSTNATLGENFPVWKKLVIPLTFYKIELKLQKQKSKDGDVLKNLIVTDMKTKNNRKARIVVKNLPGDDSYVVISRQLGTRRFSTFVNSNKK